MDAFYTKDGYEAIAGWLPWDPVELPTTVGIQFETEGDPPMKDGTEVVFWTEQGERIQWGTTIESTLKLLPSDVPAEEFPTREENLWGRHTVYVPEPNG
jgi:hypothetical protein